MHKVLSLLFLLIMSTFVLHAQDTIQFQIQDTTPILNTESITTLDSSKANVPQPINTILPTIDSNNYILLSDSNNIILQHTTPADTLLPVTDTATLETIVTDTIDHTDTIQLNHEEIEFIDDGDTINALDDELEDVNHIELELEEDTNSYIPYVHPISKTQHEIDSLRTLLQFYIKKLDSCNIANEATIQHLNGVQDELSNTTQRLDKVSHLRDSLLITNEKYQKELRNTNSLLEDQVKAMKEKELLLHEREAIYREAMTSSTVDRAKLEGEIENKNISIEAKAREIGYLQQDIDNKAQTLTAQKEDYERLTKERDRYLHIVDSLRAMVRAAELENVRKDEANKYLAQRAKEAEEKVAHATSRKRKVRPIQGIAMRLFRTPIWEILLTPETSPEGVITYNKTVRNRNAGNVEFDFVTGASVMLWDLTKYFNPKHDADSISKKHPIPNFDQQFAYDLGLYVGFGGTNIFKNFYIAPSFRFVDFFYITIGINICEYELLDKGFEAGSIIPDGYTLDNITTKVWKVKPYISFNIDLDFLSYIKK